MRGPQKQALIVAGALGALAAAIVVPRLAGDSRPAAVKTPTITPSNPSCLAMPGRVPLPSWYPGDLPLTSGSYATDLKPPQINPAYKQGIFAVKGSLREFVQHVSSVWPLKGWTLGRGDAEPGEAEDTFVKQGEDRFGTFRANSSLCDPNWTLVYIVLGTRAAPAPTGSGTPLQP